MAWYSKWRSAIFIFLLLHAHWATPSQDIMKKLTTGFVKALETCKKELNLGDHIMQDFYNYWKEEYELLHTDTGCAIMCMASKLDLITDEGKLHHRNAHEFAKGHGADDDMAKQLIEMIHECEKTHSDIADDCSKTLEIAKCFRTKIHALKWAPSMETIIEELMIEV